ncbi:MAG: PHP domain-containing protein [Candidatus Thermoplasmatota archaeon]
MRLEVDLHIHSLHSPDSMSRPGRIVGRARELGLAAIAVTDHGSWDGWREANAASGGDPIVVPGAELKTSKGDLLALFVEEPVPATDWAEAIDMVRARGGVAVVPHPAESRRLTKEDIAMADALEAFNAKCGRRSNGRAAALARELGLPGLASSDAHMVAAVGNGRTSVPEFHSTEELRRVLLKDPVISRAETTNPILHYGNASLCFGLKGVWKR